MEVFKKNPGPPPVYQISGCYQGQVKLMTCPDKRALHLFSKEIPKIGEVWSGAKLEVLSVYAVQRRPRKRSWISLQTKDSENIIKTIQVCNPKVSARNWKTAKFQEHREF